MGQSPATRQLDVLEIIHFPAGKGCTYTLLERPVAPLTPSLLAV